MRPRRLLDRLCRGQLTNVAFPDLQRLMEALGFALERIAGSHHVYRHRTARCRISLQARCGEAKPYQLRQILDFVRRYDIELEEDL